MGPGVTEKTISIGILTAAADSSAALGTLGGVGNGAVNFGDWERYGQIVVDDINARGGMAGRKVAPYYFPWSISRSVREGGNAGQAQAACSRWIQDHRVFAVVQLGFDNYELLDCLTKKQVGLSTVTNIEAKRYGGISDLYFSYNALLDRRAKTYVDGLDRQGFFGSEPTIGLVYGDDGLDYEHTANGALKAALAKRGFRVAATAAETEWTNFGNAVLRFRTAGVDHVVFWMFSPALTVPSFMQAAENQGYRPRYGISTAELPGATLRDLAPAAQLRNAVGPGWSPASDLLPAGYQREMSGSPTLDRCMTVMRKGGEETADPLAKAVQYGMCRFLWILDAGVDRADAITPAGLTSSVRRHWREFLPEAKRGVWWFQSLDPSGGRFGPTHYKSLIFDDGCECFVYAKGGPYKITW